MPPYVRNTESSFPKLVAPQAGPRKYEYINNIILYLIFIHTSAVYGFYLLCTTVTWKSILFLHLYGWMAFLGFTAGSHRLWSHRSFKAKMPLQIILMLLNSITGLYSIISLAWDHRLHHKCSDTDGDPNNSSRGFFYSHIGWICVKRHPEAVRRRKLIDVSDLWANPVLRFQKKYFIPISFSMGYILPITIQMYFFEETFNTAHFVVMYRQVFFANLVGCINSAAHLFGNRPYDVKIQPRQNSALSLLALGEGFHNYHHTFPWDYRAAEFGNDWLNFTTKFIDFFAWIGWAYDLKEVPEDMAHSRALRTGDGSNLWGIKRTNLKIE